MIGECLGIHTEEELNAAMRRNQYAIRRSQSCCSSESVELFGAHPSESRQVHFSLMTNNSIINLLLDIIVYMILLLMNGVLCE